MKPSTLFVALLGLFVGVVDCSDKPYSSRQGYALGGTSTCPRDITRRIQSWVIKQRAIPKTRSLSQRRRRPKASTQQGSLFTFQRPTKANIGRWFGIDEDPGNLRCMLQRQFNHGMSHLSGSEIDRDFETYVVVFFLFLPPG
jgi:hypothetical protein